MKTIITALCTLALSATAYADNSGQKPGPTVWVQKSNESTYNALSSQASSLGARLNSYNTRAMTPTSSPGVYASRKAEQKSLGQEVQRYNSQVMTFASRNPAPPSSQKSSTGSSLYGHMSNAEIGSMVRGNMRRR